MSFDEGYTDDSEFDHATIVASTSKATVTGEGEGSEDLFAGLTSPQDREELAYKLLASLPRSRLATIQRKLAPLLQFDIVGALPAEISLQIFTYLPCPTLLACGLVSHRWHSLANDQTLWKHLCRSRGWTWRQQQHALPTPSQPRTHEVYQDSDDEGMGDSDEEADEEEVADTLILTGIEAAKAELTQMHAELDSGFASMSFEKAPLFKAFLRSRSTSSAPTTSTFSNTNDSIRSSTMHYTPSKGKTPISHHHRTAPQRNSAPSTLQFLTSSTSQKPNYKLLYLTHLRIQRRMFTSAYRRSTLQARDANTGQNLPPNSHTNTIYCLQLYTYASTGKQVLFTGSRDKTIRQWNIAAGCVERVFSGVHTSSVLSVCAAHGMLASAGSDRRVIVWDLGDREDGQSGPKVLKVIEDHEDSVLCVRFDKDRLVSCSKDRTVRTYTFPSLEPQFVLRSHRAAVNAVSISSTLIVSGSGDRSVRLWDARTGALLRTFENHHSRGIASIDFKLPYVLSGSSDKHLRLLDVTTLQGWCTSPEVGFHHHQPHPNNVASVTATNGNPVSLNHGDVLPLPLSAFDASSQSQLLAADDEDDLLSFTFPYSSSRPHTFAACQVCGSTSTVPVYGGSVYSSDDHCHGQGFNDLSPFNVFSGGRGSSGSNFSSTNANRPVMMVGPGGRRFVPGFNGRGSEGGSTMHADLVRSVAFGGDFVLSGSYDLSIKVWDRKTGALVADLTGGHTGRIFSIGFDGTKIVSCGEDQKICIWDFAHGIDTNFVQL